MDKQTEKQKSVTIKIFKLLNKIQILKVFHSQKSDFVLDALSELRIETSAKCSLMVFIQLS